MLSPTAAGLWVTLSCADIPARQPSQPPEMRIQMNLAPERKGTQSE
jgi:hypothetical protein